MIAGTHLCLDLRTCRCALIETVDQCPLSCYYRFGKNEKARACGRCNDCNAIKVSVCGVTTQRWERRTLGQDVDAFAEDAQMLVSKY
jgi:hypothetical protein